MQTWTPGLYPMARLEAPLHITPSSNCTGGVANLDPWTLPHGESQPGPTTPGLTKSTLAVMTLNCAAMLDVLDA